MTRYLVISAALALQGCSSSNDAAGDDSGSTGTDAAANDGSSEDTGSSKIDSSAQDTGSGHDTGAGADSTAQDGGPPGDTSTTDSAQDAVAASDAGCPSSWLAPPGIDPSIAVPDGGGGVLLHASASGTQDYTCSQGTGDAGTVYTWKFVGPEASLSDCNAAVIGHHFASDGGPAAPEWQTTDGTYVIGSKLSAFTPDGGASSIPWLLLQGVMHGGTGTLGNAQYVQRLATDGGVAPTATCDQNSVGTTVKVPYGADYYFFGP